MRPSLLVGLLASCAVLSWVPASAVAERGNAPRGPEAFFFLEGSNGYGIFVAAVDDWVVVGAWRKKAMATYVVRGRIGADRIEARLGDLGQISVEFVPLGGKRRTANPCRRSPVDLGIFRGRIAFRGELGYTVAKESSTIGLWAEPRPRRCSRRAGARDSALPRSSLDTHISAISRRKGAVTSFELSRKRGRSWLELDASLESRSEGMLIFRQTSTVVGGPNAFAASGPDVVPQFAFIAAPKPFNGSAVFDAAAGPGLQWSGDLSAWMPGAAWVPLAGPSFATSFCRRGPGEPGCSGEPPVRKPFLGGPQGSGSQSQALAEARLSWSRYLRNSASSLGSTP